MISDTHTLNIELILEFFNTSANLKKIMRQGWIDKLSIIHPESVADHTFSMSIIGMVLSDLEGYNTEKILKMIILHDLAESIIGDITPEQKEKKEKFDLENNSMQKILSSLPESIKCQYETIWNGEAIKIISKNLDKNKTSVGYFYWNDIEKKIAMFLLEEAHVATVSGEDFAL